LPTFVLPAAATIVVPPALDPADPGAPPETGEVVAAAPALPARLLLPAVPGFESFVLSSSLPQAESAKVAINASRWAFRYTIRSSLRVTPVAWTDPVSLG
jgi:hypothetical protein